MPRTPITFQPPPRRPLCSIRLDNGKTVMPCKPDSTGRCSACQRYRTPAPAIGAQAPAKRSALWVEI